MNDRDIQNRLANWFRQWQSPLLKYLKRKGIAPAGDLEDIAQEVFLRLMRYERTELVEQPQAYLYKMATNVAAEWAIRFRNSRPHSSQWVSELVVPDASLRSFEQTEVQREVRRAIETLGPRQAMMLSLHFLEGLSHAEIAARLGSSPRTVKRVLIQSYVKLRRELDPRLLGAFTDGRE